MTILVYDGSWSGLLTAVFEAYERKLTTVKICSAKDFQEALLDDSIKVHTDEVKARRVWAGLAKKISSVGLQRIYHSYLSEIAGIEDYILGFIQLALSVKDAEKAYANSAVLKVTQIAKIVYREKHRMEAFVRFKLTKDNIFYSAIEPDFNVLPILVSHFEKRYADQKWLIYDLRRNYGIYYNLEQVEEVELQNSTSAKENDSIFAEDEMAYQSLWKDYFTHINIKERKNSKLHLRHVPKRYWKHLTEK